MTTLNPVLAATTDRLIARSRDTRSRYLERIREAGDRGPARGRLACANIAHGFAAADPQAKRTLRANVKPNVAIVSAYNDMLSAHKPFESYPALLKKSVHRGRRHRAVRGRRARDVRRHHPGPRRHATVAVQP